MWEMQPPNSASHLAGVMEIFETGDVMFQKLRSNVRDSHVKDLTTAVGLMCFPAGLEGPEPMVRGSHKGHCRVRTCIDSQQDPLTSLPISCNIAYVSALIYRALFPGMSAIYKLKVWSCSNEFCCHAQKALSTRSVLTDLGLCSCSGIQAAQPTEAPEWEECCRGGSNIYTPANLLNSGSSAFRSA